jgi:preprotein translocase subunit YajC
MAYYCYVLAQSGLADSGMMQIVTVFIIPIAILWAVMYFLTIRPQKRRERERKAMLANLKKNERVLTTGGIIGTVMEVRDHEVILKVDDKTNTRIKFARAAVIDLLSAAKGEKVESDES